MNSYSENIEDKYFTDKNIKGDKYEALKTSRIDYYNKQYIKNDRNCLDYIFCDY